MSLNQDPTSNFKPVASFERYDIMQQSMEQKPAPEEPKRIITASSKIEPSVSKEDICIDVKDVSVMFNLSKNREDGVKEYFINMIKGKIGFTEFWDLRNINLQVKKGDSLALIGRNGSGKSTLLKTIAGIIRPARGTIKVEGSIAPLIEISGGFDRSLSARENIYLVGTMHGHTKKYIKSRFDEIVDFAEIEKFIDVPVKNYSSGMLARLGFALATCVNADIIIADEVLSVGDARFKKKCEERISQMLSGGTTFLFVSHSTAQVKKLCKRAVWLEKGKIMEEGPSEKVCHSYAAFMKSIPIKHAKKPDKKDQV